MRAVEAALGIGISGSPFPVSHNQNATASLLQLSQSASSMGETEVAQALADAAPILVNVVAQLGEGSILVGGHPLRTPLVTKYSCPYLYAIRS